MKRTICSFYKTTCNIVLFDIINVENQRNSHDCGVYALAFATKLAHRKDPSLCRWDGSDMRQHLITCFEERKLSCFPTIGRRRTPLGRRVRKFYSETLYCKCRQPNDPKRAMIACDKCWLWFHKDCMGLDATKSFKKMDWMCYSCQDTLNSLK